MDLAIRIISALFGFICFLIAFGLGLASVVFGLAMWFVPDIAVIVRLGFGSIQFLILAAIFYRAAGNFMDESRSERSK